MILTIKKFFPNKDNDYEKMTSKVGQMKIFLEHILAGRVPNEKYSADSLLSFCRSLVEGQRGSEAGLADGSWSVCSSALDIDEDDRMDYHFFPTFIALSLLISCASRDSRVKTIPGFDDALKRGFSFAISENLEGLGFNSFFQQMEACLIMGSGGCFLWLKEHPDCCPPMAEKLKQLGVEFKKRLSEGETVLPFGGDYKVQFQLACQFLAPLMESSS
ncbi:hypothetical protein EXM22_15400 [Oceanispirochaeta crateris]|uniref:Uncharacterized protein n=1 Tax=Oceanispirochaeta crateris TaxID=2518645 RepID=A0A5C1QMH1_9SPIO|nr:hypothetical protein [Oceanispirochaeta crateris]QEN09295.1 hypothetical protein EXM22_15400 [Oceanispirochaeta crateris]